MWRFLRLCSRRHEQQDVPRLWFSLAPSGRMVWLVTVGNERRIVGAGHVGRG